MNKPLIKYAKVILDSRHREEVIQRIVGQAMTTFRHGTFEEREAVSNMLNSIDLFYGELEKIVSEDTPMNDIDEEIQPLDREGE